MENKRYNGYTNYETWNVALWIDNRPFQLCINVEVQIL